METALTIRGETEPLDGHEGRLGNAGEARLLGEVGPEKEVDPGEGIKSSDNEEIAE